MFGNNVDNSACRKTYEQLFGDSSIYIKEPCSRKECKEKDCIRHPSKYQGENSP